MRDNQEAETVMQVFGAFMKKRVVLTKIKKVSDHKHSQPIGVGVTIEGDLSYFPKVGESFNIANAWVKNGNPYEDTQYERWCSSVIVNILPNNMIETKNSIYQWNFVR